jgi:arginine utilization protein RocB
VAERLAEAARAAVEAAMANLNKTNKDFRKGANKGKRKIPENRKRNQSYEDGGVSRSGNGATGEDEEEGTDNILGVVRRR